MRRILALTTTLAAAVATALPATSAVAVPTSTAAAGTDIVQMGDSYSSGNGAGSYTEKTCWRSTENYGARVARQMGARYRNVACSGGVVADILAPRELGSPKKRVKSYRIAKSHPDRAAEWLRLAKRDQLCGKPGQSDWYYRYSMTAPAPGVNLYTATLSCQLTARPQIDAVSKDTDLVFLTIGGNDIGFTTIVTQCMVLREPGGCRKAMESADRQVVDMGARAKRVIAAVHKRSGGKAKVYLLGYPYLMNRTSYGIPEVAPTYDAGRALTALQQKGDRVQREVMTSLSKEVRRGAFTFVDVKPSWGGHRHGIDPRTYGSQRQAWLVPVLGPGREYKEWVHPTSEGWGASALALRGAI